MYFFQQFNNVSSTLVVSKKYLLEKCCSHILVTSSGEAASKHSDTMGSYDFLKPDKNGFDIWKHSTRDVFFYKEAVHGFWGVSTKLSSNDQRIFVFIMNIWC